MAAQPHLILAVESATAAVGAALLRGEELLEERGGAGPEPPSERLLPAIDAVAPGQWTGPIESPYGLHLVLVPERVAAARPALPDVRPLVERELLAERRRVQLRRLYERLLQKYTVSIEMPREAAAKPAGGGQ